MAERVLTINELKTTSEWYALSQKQKLFIETYLGVGDAAFATLQAYNCASPRIAKIFSYEILAKAKIRRVLNLFFGRDASELDDVMPKLLRAIKKSVKRDLVAGGISEATVKALEFYERNRTAADAPVKVSKTKKVSHAR